MVHKGLSFLALVASAFLLLACEAAGAASDSGFTTPDPVDPAFREFYDFLGGEELMGAAISPLFENNGIEYQYTVAGLLVHDPQASGSQFFRLAPLGLDMGIAEPPVPDPNQPDVRYLNGHVISEVFLPLFDRLGGAHYVGNPITEMHFNPEKGRYEQYFENLGMYLREGDDPEHARLLAYGAWKCDASCRKPPLGDNLVKLPYPVAELFVDAVARLGSNFTGFAITEAYRTPDGYIEQVYESVVLVSDPRQRSHIFSRPITQALGIRPDPPVGPNNQPGFSFYPLQDGKGYNIPEKFLNYIAQHGGMEISGEPITELSQTNPAFSRQCFTNLCLEERRTPSGKLVIQPTQLGYTYRMLPHAPLQEEKDPVGSISQGEDRSELSSASTGLVSPLPPGPELSMRVWKSYPMLPPNQEQEIGVSILENNHPRGNLEPYLILILPGDHQRTYYMDPTGDDGVSRIRLEPIQQPNGTLIPFQVCVLDRENEKYCIQDSFMIWGEE